MFLELESAWFLPALAIYFTKTGKYAKSKQIVKF
jgi:hypothetical protein